MRWPTNLKIDQTKIPSIIKYLQKKSMIPRDIYEHIAEILNEDTFSFATVQMWTLEFKWGKDDNTEDYSRVDRSKSYATDEYVDTIHRMVLDDRRLIV